MSGNRCLTIALASASSATGLASIRRAISGTVALNSGESLPIHTATARRRAVVVAVGKVRRTANIISSMGMPAFLRRFISLTMSAGSVAIILPSLHIPLRQKGHQRAAHLSVGVV